MKGGYQREPVEMTMIWRNEMKRERNLQKNMRSDASVLSKTIKNFQDALKAGLDFVVRYANQVRDNVSDLVNLAVLTKPNHFDSL